MIIAVRLGTIARVLLVGLLVATWSLPSQAKRVQLIRDAEIEDTIRGLAEPIFTVAGVGAGAVQVHLVDVPAINAFVAGGQKIFVHTGLLMNAETPNQIVGVLAHETGHIVGGHLARTRDALENASTPMIAALLLGAAAAVAGAPQAAAGILAGGAQLSQRSFLLYSRTQEAAADQAAIRFLEQTGQSPLGMLETFEAFVGQEALLTENQDPYVRSHPLPRERIETLRAAVEQSPYRDRKPTDEQMERHARMRAKLTGFLKAPQVTFRTYPPTDASIPARYARAIAYHRQNDRQGALGEINALINLRPEDPYFRELKGQVLFESGSVAEAVEPYTEAVRLKPDSTLLRIGLAQAQLGAEDPALVAPARETLELAVRDDKDNASAWHWLSIAYAREGDESAAALAAAERYMLVGEPRYAQLQAEKVLRLASNGTPEYLRAQDLKHAADYSLQNADRR